MVTIGKMPSHSYQARSIARRIVGLEVDSERVHFVGGVVSTVAFERASRLEVEECGRSVGLALSFDLCLEGSWKRDLGCVRVDTRSELLCLLDGRSRMR